MTTMFRSFLAGRLPLAVRGGYDFVMCATLPAASPTARRTGSAAAVTFSPATIQRSGDMLEALKSAAGVRRTVTYLPLRLARSAAKVCEKFTRRGKKPFFTPYSIAVLGSNADFSHSAASRTFGYAPRPLLATLRDTAHWLCRQSLSRRNMKL